MKDRARSKTREIFVTVGALLSCVDGISVSRPAGSRNDARLVEPGKLLRQYTRPKGECTAGTIYMWEQYIRYAMQKLEDIPCLYTVRFRIIALHSRIFFNRRDFLPATSFSFYPIKDKKKSFRLISKNCFEIFNYKA